MIEKNLQNKQFITYESPYGGQSIRVTEAKRAFERIIKFLNEFTEFEKIKNYDLKIYLPKQDERGYNLKELSNEAEKLFGKGEKSIWAEHISNKLDKNYRIEWTLPFLEIDRAIEFLDRNRELYRYPIGPIGIHFFVSFFWKNKKYNLLFREIGESLKFSHAANSATIILSKNNNINLNLTFPFEEPTKEFIDFQKEIMNSLHIKMPVRNYRIWIPNKSKTDYNIRKINFELKDKWEEAK